MNRMVGREAVVWSVVGSLGVALVSSLPGAFALGLMGGFGLGVPIMLTLGTLLTLALGVLDTPRRVAEGDLRASMVGAIPGALVSGCVAAVFWIGIEGTAVVLFVPAIALISGGMRAGYTGSRCISSAVPNGRLTALDLTTGLVAAVLGGHHRLR